MLPVVESFFDDVTSTFTHVVFAANGGPAVIIDPVLDYDPKSGRTRPISADAVIAFVRENDLRVEWILETHAHADHLSAAQYLKTALGGRVGIGEPIRVVQSVFKGIFNLGPDFIPDGTQFDRLLADGDTIECGLLKVTAIAVPGHTPACMAYEIGDAIFLGDTLFMPDVGTARCDFPGGDARTLYRSIRKLLERSSDTRLFLCHDYPVNGRAATAVTSIAAQRSANIHVRDGISEDEFVKMRTTRDASLQMPVLILPAIQVNIRAGHLPPPESNGTSYLKIPLNAL